MWVWWGRWAVASLLYICPPPPDAAPTAEDTAAGGLYAEGEEVALLEHQLLEVEVRDCPSRAQGLGSRLGSPAKCSFLSAPRRRCAAQGAVGEQLGKMRLFWLPWRASLTVKLSECGVRGRLAAGAGEPELLPGTAAADGEGAGGGGRQATDRVPHGEHWMASLCPQPGLGFGDLIPLSHREPVSVQRQARMSQRHTPRRG